MVCIFSSIVPLPGVTYPRALVSSVQCRGYESSLDQCKVMGSFQSTTCFNSKTATVVCAPKQTTYGKISGYVRISTMKYISHGHKLPPNSMMGSSLDIEYLQQ